MHKKEEMSLEDFLTNGWKIMKPAFTIDEVCLKNHILKLLKNCIVSN